MAFGGPSQGMPAPGEAGAQPPAPPEPKGHSLKSPRVGAFYRAPSPGAPSFVEVVQVVYKGQTICIIVSMKLWYECESAVSGTTKPIVTANGRLAEYRHPPL